MEVCVSNRNQKENVENKFSGKQDNAVVNRKNKMIGKQSVEFGTPVRIRCSASVVGKKEGQGPLGHLFDKICTDDTFGTKSWEAAESALQKTTVELCLEKSNAKIEDIRYLFAGDWLGQCIASSLGLAEFNRPLSGLEITLIGVISLETILREFVSNLRESYDYIIIDCMPSLGMLTVNALASADSVLIPVQAAYLPTKGLQQLIKTIGRVKRQLNPQLEIEGILLR